MEVVEVEEEVDELEEVEEEVETGEGGGGGVPNKNGEHGRDLVLNAWCKLELRNRLKTLARCSLKCLFWKMFDVNSHVLVFHPFKP